MTAIDQSTEFTLVVNQVECAELLNLLEREFRETTWRLAARNHLLVKPICIIRNPSFTS